LATQDALERRRDTRRIELEFEKLGFGRKIKRLVLIRLWLKKPSIDLVFIFIDWGINFGNMAA